MKFKLILACSLLVFLVYSYSNYFTIGMVKGIYVNKNYENSYFGANFLDTLNLFENNQFKSGFWGVGHYKLSYSLRGTSIKLYSKNSLITKVYRSWFSKPRIMIMKDLDNYYEKQ